jgi:hypothetical protein
MSSANPNHWSSLLTLQTLLPLAAGAVIGWCGNWYFYHRSVRDAEVQARSMETQLRISRTLLEIFERQGDIELARDADGNITGGRVIHLAGNAVSESTATGTLTVGPKATPQQDH